MVRLTNEAFQYLKVFNLDLHKVYSQVFDLPCLQRKLLIVEGALEKLTRARVPLWCFKGSSNDSLL